MNAYAGFIHQDRENHPTLASDMMEEWRAIIVDSVVLSLIQGHEVSFDGFRVDHETGGVLLTDEAFRIFIKKYEKKMRSESSYLSASGRKNCKSDR